MKHGEDPHCRPDIVKRARARLAAGFYDVDEVVDGALEAGGIRLLWEDLCRCPVGAGSQYRDAVSSFLPAIFKDTFDEAYVGVELGNSGARIDVELPLRIEGLSGLPLWDRWASDYGIRSVLVEVKNEEKKAAVEDAKQLIGDLVVAGRGRFGLLIARNGFSSAAVRYMGQVAKATPYLIIPLSHGKLYELCKLSANGPEAVCGALREVATELLQAA